LAGGVGCGEGLGVLVAWWLGLAEGAGRPPLEDVAVVEQAARSTDAATRPRADRLPLGTPER
jgi:hypothetical protein